MPWKTGIFAGALTPILWSVVIAAGVLGLIALVSPRHFSAIARAGNHWVDTSKWLAKFDTRVDVDSRLLPYSRQLGAAVLASVAVLAMVLMNR